MERRSCRAGSRAACGGCRNASPCRLIAAGALRPEALALSALAGLWGARA